MNRHEFIQSIINKMPAKSYLEIGLGNGENFNKINVSFKSSVDPASSTFKNIEECTATPTYKLTSDDFFKQNKDKFDVIFIDGLHHADQVERDINNSLSILNKDGYILCHDINPTNKELQEVPRKNLDWTGDVWKAWVKLKSTNPNISMVAVDDGMGWGVIQKNKDRVNNLQELTKKNGFSNLTNFLL